MHFAKFDEIFVNEHIQNAGLFEVNQGCEQGRAADRFFAPCCQHGQGGGQNGSAHTKAQGVDLRDFGDVSHHLNGLNRTLLNIVIPTHLGMAGVRVAPTHHKCAMALRHHVADERVFRLQVQYIVLIDARRNQKKRLLVDFGRQGFVFDELKQVVFKHHMALGGGDILAHLEQAFVRHGNVALAQVVPQILNAFGNAFALAVNGFLLSIRIQQPRVARCTGRTPLLDGKTNALAGLVVPFQGVGQTHQGAGVEQVNGR